MIINFDMLKTFYSAIVNKMKGFRGNWNQNDPTADDYIKGRTHWVAQEEVTFTGSDIVLDGFPIFDIGDTVNVKIDGVEYSLVAYDSDGWASIGDTWIDMEDGVGEYGWMIFCVPYDDIIVFCSFEVHTISYTAEMAHKLDKKFMPESYVESDNLANVAFTGNYYDLNNIPTEVQIIYPVKKYINVISGTTTRAQLKNEIQQAIDRNSIIYMYIKNSDGKRYWLHVTEYSTDPVYDDSTYYEIGSNMVTSVDGYVHNTPYARLMINFDGDGVVTNSYFGAVREMVIATENNSKRFKITVDDNGTLITTEI